MNLRAEFEKMARDITSGPDLSDMAEVGIVGAAVGGALGLLKGERASTLKSYALWGAGIGVAGQFLLFHALRASAKHGKAFVGNGMMPATGCPVGTEWSDWYGRCVQTIPPPPPRVGDGMMPATGCPVGTEWSDWYGKCVQTIPPPPPRVGDGMMPATGCPSGTYWSDYYGRCVQNIPSPPPAFPPTLDDWRKLHATGFEDSGDEYVGAVAGIGGYRPDKPFGPGPWPTHGFGNPRDGGW